MRDTILRLLDGLATGLAISGLLGLAALLAGADSQRFSGWLFYAGGGLLLLAAIWGMASPGGTGGLLRWSGLLPEPSETDPDAPETLGRQIWVDRFATSRNVWLSAGLTLLALSFALLLAG